MVLLIVELECFSSVDYFEVVHGFLDLVGVMASVLETRPSPNASIKGINMSYSMMARAEHELAL